MERFMAKIKSIATTFSLFIAGLLLTDHAKRILLLTSLQVQLVKDGVFHEDSLPKLNFAMDLVSHEDAMRFPAQVYRSIWEHTALKECLDPVADFDFTSSCLPFDEARRVAEAIATRSVPKWLRYGFDGEMVNDIIRLFYCQPSLSKTATA